MIGQEDRTRDRGRARRFACLTAFALAMGVLEAVVVVYLRELYYPGGFRFPIAPMPGRIALAELTREAATLVMLLAVAALAGSEAHGRFYAFAFVFGVWDLTYYAGLFSFLGWPSSIWTWDILFLIPVPWAAPVFYPALVSVLLIAGYLVHEALRERGLCGLCLSAGSWLLASAGALAIVVSFCWHWRDVTGGKVPESFPGGLFAAGLLVAAFPFARAGVKAVAKID